MLDCQVYMLDCDMCTGWTVTGVYVGLWQVYMLDYGYTDTLNDLQLRPLNPTHAAVQCFAERCHLVNLMPAGSTDRNKWSITAREFILKEISDHNLFVKLEVLITCNVAMTGLRCPCHFVAHSSADYCALDAWYVLLSTVTLDTHCTLADLVWMSPCYRAVGFFLTGIVEHLSANTPVCLFGQGLELF